MAWATVEDVAAHIGLPADDRMAANLEEAQAWAERKRPDLDAFEPQNAAIRKAVCIYAGLLYRERSTPQGIAGYESEGGGFIDSTAYYRCLDMLGRRPVAR
jgi:hypothetical protein